ncbi:Co2+/Mg2+ efflux protein ApaG [bacterium]|nr:Co2+/Mg2+ efflux protein ApaG [bacterium]
METNGVLISVDSQFSQFYSAPPYRYFFSYHVTIANNGKKAVQLLSRRWVIKDAAGRVQVVEGAGVVGEQPHILPGQSFQYTSGCPLPTPYGEMSGWYLMVDSDGDSFEAMIPAFKLVKIEDAEIN